MREKSFIAELLAKFIGDQENRVAFAVFDGKQLTNIAYNRLADDVLRAAAFFRENKIFNEHIALIASNSYEWIVSFFAIAASGNVAVPLNPDLPPETLRWQCEKTDTSILLGEASIMAELEPNVKNKTFLSYIQLRSSTPASLAEVYAPDQDTTVVLMFTSGTTGKSKAVEISYGNMWSSINSSEGVFTMSGVDRVMTVLPWHHIAGLRGILAMLYRYKTLCIGRGSRYLIEDMPVFNPSYAQLVPAIADSMLKILKHTRTDEERWKYLGGSLRRICIGGANANPATCRYLMEQGIVIDGGYAMTETTGVGTWGEWDDVHFSTIGKLSGELQCRIQDGELLLKGPSVMKGYYKDPDATAAVIEDGWLHTGDLGFCDADGYYYLSGRKKNVIILANGQNINPEEIEEAFYECDAIRECVVYHNGKAICADIYTHNQEMAARYINDYNEKMPMYRQVYKVNYFAVPLEKTDSGKIKRRENKSWTTGRF